MSQGPPEHAGPPDHARARRRDDGTIEIGEDDRLGKLEDQIDWDDLSPFEEWVVLQLRSDND